MRGLRAAVVGGVALLQSLADFSRLPNFRKDPLYPQCDDADLLSRQIYGIKSRPSRPAPAPELAAPTDDLGAKYICDRRPLESNPEFQLDALHCYGVDRLSTAEIMEYFGDFAPWRVVWLDDSSCNVVFGDPGSASQAYHDFCEELTVPIHAIAPREEGEPDPWEGTEAAPKDPMWRRGRDYTKSGITYPVLVRFATALDRKENKKPRPSKRLWLDSGQRQEGAAAGGGWGAGEGSYGRVAKVRRQA